MKSMLQMQLACRHTRAHTHTHMTAVQLLFFVVFCVFFFCLTKLPLRLKSEIPGYLWLADLYGCHGDLKCSAVCVVRSGCVCSAREPTEPFILLWHTVSGRAWLHISSADSPTLTRGGRCNNMTMHSQSYWGYWFLQTPPCRTERYYGCLCKLLSPESDVSHE